MAVAIKAGLGIVPGMVPEILSGAFMSFFNGPVDQYTFLCEQGLRDMECGRIFPPGKRFG